MKRIHKHVKKHKKHYARFVFFFLFLILYGVAQDLTVSQIVHGEFLRERVIVAFVIAFIFTLAAETISKYFRTSYPR